MKTKKSKVIKHQGHDTQRSVEYAIECLEKTCDQVGARYSSRVSAPFIFVEKLIRSRRFPRPD